MLKINKEACISCGLCNTLCPDVFELKSDGKSSVKKNADLKKNKECVKEAKDSCPTGAIVEK